MSIHSSMQSKKNKKGRTPLENTAKQALDEKPNLSNNQKSRNKKRKQAEKKNPGGGGGSKTQMGERRALSIETSKCLYSAIFLNKSIRRNSAFLPLQWEIEFLSVKIIKFNYRVWNYFDPPSNNKLHTQLNVFSHLHLRK